MHSVYARFNNISATLSTCMMVLLGAIACTSLLFSADPKGDITALSGESRPRRYGASGRRQEFAFVNFNVTADLTPLFNWNTKQLFLYLGAEYTNAQGVQNEVVIWDRIVRRKEDAMVNVEGKNSYAFRELSTKFQDISPAHYTLKYNVMPWVGVLTYGEAARTTEPIPFPNAKDRVS
ncbi:signal peptidase subunit [Stereum hirsutum FP-91666 SS1]|uniref:signal peptidase subunit n=1 Tax=Stereum hirsutum (strain FP-91666) TaxID=721885 RepID=UPI000444A2E7|nr:signal peptidase subunit [Stereum hirsutum FP-91666 SS1]EIM81320.1 signal peptidase subunit [Stereum hirsutum FP-91666 SS1]